MDEAGPVEFVHLRPYVQDQESSAKRNESVGAVIVHSGREPAVVNLVIPSPEENLTTPEPDPLHSGPRKL